MVDHWKVLEPWLRRNLVAMAIEDVMDGKRGCKIREMKGDEGRNGIRERKGGKRQSCQRWNLWRWEGQVCTF